MRRALALALALILAGCGREAPRAAEGAGARLEAAATAAGMVPDTKRGALTGSWTLDTDRACVVPGDDRGSRIGVLVDYGEGQGCAGSGTIGRDGERLDVRLGTRSGECRITARYDGERIVFPAEVPDACRELCTGRASLESFTVERVSESRSEAATLRTPGGRTLCPD